MITLFFDGLCEPRNPGGYACYGWLITRDGQALVSGKGVAAHGAGSTNNVAEYHALIEGLKAAGRQNLAGDPVEVRGDSQLVINQINGDWQCNQPHLRALRDEARQLARALGRVRFTWIPREQNEPADRLSREAYKEQGNK